MEIKDRKGLREKLGGAFKMEELQTLCLDLDIEYENFSPRKSKFIADLIDYFVRRNQLPHLISQLESERPEIEWAPFFLELEKSSEENNRNGDMSSKVGSNNAKANILNGNKLTRDEWFNQQGFARDRYPFGSTARRGEVDRILKNYPETFVFPPDLPGDQLLETKDRTGYVYFFGPSGCGKTSLLQYMKDLIAEQVTSTVTIEYFSNFKPYGDSNLFFANQIVERIYEQVDDLIIPATNNPTELISKIVKQCNDKGIRSIYVLVDQVDSDPAIDFTSIMSLVANRNFLEIENLLFKFFLPFEYKKHLARQIEIYGYFELMWNQELLKKALNQRLSACLKEDLRSNITPLGLLCEQDLASDIENKLFEFVTIDTPRQMWLFLDMLVDMHFSGENSARLITERITTESFKKVCKKFNL